MKCLCLRLAGLCGLGEPLEQQMWSVTISCMFTCLIGRLSESWQYSFKCCHFVLIAVWTWCALTCVWVFMPPCSVWAHMPPGCWWVAVWLAMKSAVHPCSLNYCEQLINYTNKNHLKNVCGWFHKQMWMQTCSPNQTWGWSLRLNGCCCCVDEHFFFFPPFVYTIQNSRLLLVNFRRRVCNTWTYF